MTALKQLFLKSFQWTTPLFHHTSIEYCSVSLSLQIINRLGAIKQYTSLEQIAQLHVHLNKEIKTQNTCSNMYISKSGKIKHGLHYSSMNQR